MSQDANLASGLAYRLQQLSDLLDELQTQVYQQDEKAFAARLAEGCGKLFVAEAVTVFQVRDEDSRHLHRLALSCQISDPKVSNKPLPIPVLPCPPKTGLSGRCVAENIIIREHGDNLRQHEWTKGKPNTHLRGGVCHSLLAVPLQLKAGRPLGLLKIDNKFGPDGRPSDAASFSAEDEFFAKILSRKVAAQFEARRVMTALRRLSEVGYKSHDQTAYYKDVLDTAIQVLRCDSAMLALVNPKYDLEMVATTRRDGGEPLPRDPHLGVMRRCWQTGEPECIPDVGACDYYHSLDPDTKSEAAVRLEWEGVKFGVLNVESHRKDHFDENDIALLCTFVPFIAASFRAVDREARFVRLMEAVGSFRWSHKSILRILLQTVLEEFGFVNGHIFLPDPDGRKLLCASRIGPGDISPSELTFDLDIPTPSVQKSVFRREEGVKDYLFSAAAEMDGRFDPVRRSHLKIVGPYLAVPLETEGKTVGVLSVWGDADSVNSQRPTLEHVPRLQRYAKFVAVLVALTSQRRYFFDTLQQAIRSLQLSSRPSDVWTMLLRIVQQSGFDRVRLLLYHNDGKYFELVSSLGPNPPAAKPQPWIYPSVSPYARDIVEQAATSSAVIKYPNDRLGPDPDADWLGKPKDLPWIVIPLVSHGRLYGQIAADNQISRKDIPDESLSDLAIIGSVAALTVAQAEAMARLTWKSLDKLHAAIRLEDSDFATVRKLLVYLSDGMALGFSRAVYFEHQPDGKGYRYMTGLGSTNENRFKGIGNLAAAKGIEQNLARAASHDDPELHLKFKDCVITQQDLDHAGLFPNGLPMAKRFTPESRGRWPGWLVRIANHIDSSLPAVVPVVGAGNSRFGVLLVDREWQEVPVSDEDVMLLTSYGRHAALILSQREAYRKMEQHRGAIWRDVALVTAHRINTPISTIETELDTLRRVVNPTDPMLAAVLVNMGAAAQHAKTLVVQFGRLRDIYRRLPNRPTTVPLHRIVVQAYQRVRDEGVLIEDQCPVELLYHGYAAGFEECLVELLSNAVYWCKRSDRLHPTVTIQAEEYVEDKVAAEHGFGHRKFIRLRVKDNGPGIDPKRIPDLGKNVGHSTRLGGTGFGLFFVWEVTRELGGNVTATTNAGGGMCFEVNVPQDEENTLPNTQPQSGRAGE